ncbi:MAG: prolipoprotein diacylglyceryl transferase [Mycoplasma sp.]|nr:prolipoprotein diacylglyceryl transferase [Mycoplasma sp.]
MIPNRAHDPHVAFTIGSLEIHTYALTMLTGMICSIGTIAWFWHKRKYSWELLELLVLVIIPTSIVGARLWYVLGSLSNPTVRENWYAFWDGGLAIEGGVLASGSAGVFVLYLNRRTVDWRDCLGIILPNVLIGQAIGRWGNFANHEVFGRLTSEGSVSWLGSWIKNNMYIITSDGTIGYRVPLFFYESITSIVGWVILVWVAQYYIPKMKPGTHAGLYLVWYGIIRSAMEPLRDPSDILHWGALDTSVFFSVIYICVGIGLFTFFQFFNNIYNYDEENKRWKLKVEHAVRRGTIVNGK